MDAHKFRTLSPRNQALVAVAVLLDGREAEHYLGIDGQDGTILSRAAVDLAAQPPDLRMPYIGSALRLVLEQVEE